MEAILPRWFNAHVCLLHVIFLFFLHLCEPLPFQADYFVITIPN